MTNENNAKITGKIVAKAWSDDGFKARLLADPAAVLRDEGLDVPAGIALTVIEDSPTRYTLVLPARPTDLSDDDLDAASGGKILCIFNCGNSF